MQELPEEIIDRYLNGNCTANEKWLVEDFFLKYLDEDGGIPTHKSIINAEKCMKKHINVKIRDDVSRKKLILLKWLPQIAATILLASFYLVLKVDWTKNPSDHIQQSTDILPAFNKATLSFGDGKSIHLSEGKGALIVKGKNIQYNDGTLVSNTYTSELTLTTPKGGQFQIILQDGSRVWLNSNTVLHYPPVFNNKRREVFLEGEAYFEVNNKSPNNIVTPFIVKTKNQEVTVLGTSFNLQAYDKEFPTKTTLLNGKVRVSHTYGSKDIELSPGYESVLENGALNSQKADVDATIAWKNGLFNFEHKNMLEVSRMLESWYEIEVAFKNGEIPQVEFFGEMYRSSKLSTVLNVLEQSGVHFKITGKKLLISK